MANNMQASVYVLTGQNDEYLVLGSGSRVFVTYQWLAQVVMLPFRWIGALVAAPLKVDVFWWLPSFCNFLDPATDKFLSLPAPLLLPFAIPALGALGAVSLAEWFVLSILNHKLVFASLVLAAAVIHKEWKKSGLTIQALKKKVV